MADLESNHNLYTCFNIINSLYFYNHHHYSICIENCNGVIRIADFECDVTDLWTEETFDLANLNEFKEFIKRVIKINLDYLTYGDNWEVKW